MAYFAKIENNTVTQILAVPNEEEHRGQEFLADDLGLGGQWVQTSWSARIRKKFAAIGDEYDPINDWFISTQPYPTWVFDETTWAWKPPVPQPNDGEWRWNEEKQQWIKVTA